MANIYAKQNLPEEDYVLEEAPTIEEQEALEEAGNCEEEEQIIEEPAPAATIKKGFG